MQFQVETHWGSKKHFYGPDELLWFGWFGAELVFALCERQGIEVVIIHQGDPPSFEEELAQDVLEIITGFRARLDDRGSPQSRKLLASLKAVADS